MIWFFLLSNVYKVELLHSATYCKQQITIKHPSRSIHPMIINRWTSQAMVCLNFRVVWFVNLIDQIWNNQFQTVWDSNFERNQSLILNKIYKNIALKNFISVMSTYSKMKPWINHFFYIFKGWGLYKWVMQRARI